MWYTVQDIISENAYFDQFERVPNDKKKEIIRRHATYNTSNGQFTLDYDAHENIMEDLIEYDMALGYGMI